MKKLLALLLTLCLTLPVAALADEAPVNVYTLMGPTGIGMVRIMNDNDGTYQFNLVSAPDEVVAAMASGHADIAAVPTNLAATLYQKLNGGVQIVALNTLGVLHILDKTGEINEIGDLAGRTLYASGQGAIPEYVLNYILAANGLTDSVTVEYKAEHAELATLAAEGMVDVCMLPEPNVTAVLMQNSDFRIALDVTALYDEANAAAGNEGATMSMGCVIVRREWAEQNADKLAAFLTAYEESVGFVNTEIEEAAEMVQAQGIMPKAAVAAKAIPNCHIVFITGETMKTMIEPFFGVLFDANPSSVGGALPAEDFYYMAQ